MPTFDLSSLQVTAPEGYGPRMVVLSGPLESFGHKEQPFRRNVVITCEDVAAGTDAEAFVKAQLGLLAQSMPGFTRVKTSTLEIDGQAVPLIEARSTGPGGMLVQNIIAYLIKGSSAFTLSATHLLGPRFEEHRNEFVDIFKSVMVRL